MPPSVSVFVSCGTPYNKRQEDFLSELEARLESHGCIPQTVGRSKFTGRQPVEASRDLIATCCGAVVVAFERTRILTGLDRPDSTSETKIANESHPTVWNHMEAAMAYAQKLPLLILVQPGLKRQGMLSDRLEWMAIEVELSPDFLRTRHFQQVFAEWLALVEQRALKPPQADVDVGGMKIGKLLSQLSTKEAGALAVIVFSLLAGLATFSFKVGQFFQAPDKASRSAAPAPNNSVQTAPPAK